MSEKQELIHLHGLFAELANHIEEEFGATVEADAYEELGVSPSAIHKSKGDHEEALFALAEATTEATEQVEADAPTA